MTNPIDTIFQSSEAKPGSFVFDQRVANVFEDMISRSVPGYQQILEMLPTLTRQFSFEGKNYYDLGCSLGAGLLAMSQGLSDAQTQLIGIDNSAAMLKHATRNLKGLDAKLIENDLLSVELNNAGMVLMNFTLQFIALEHRDKLVKRIYQSLTPGGALVLSEKIDFDNDKTNQILIDIHHQYKADQGYSALEIAKKRDAIVNVLVPESLDAHIVRLKKSGFSVVTPWVQNLQFISILAVK